ncbi:MAG: hypothetical protein BRD50_09525 [Bacteroidetes bacterium SW_11_45_7]|nr:MAG: hypothetical protein BRD50_09525 [Bacteroidetes bacterium SW_11_45_7]
MSFRAFYYFHWIILLFTLTITSCSTSKNNFDTSNDHILSDNSYRAEQVSLTPSKIDKIGIAQNNNLEIDDISKIDQNGNKKITERYDDEFLTASKKNLFKESQESKTYINDTNNCDIIILQNAEEIVAKVKVVGEDKIKYKKCSNVKGPLYTKPKSKVFLIKYADGTKDVFNESDDKKQNDVKINNNNTDQADVDESKSQKKSIEGFSLAGYATGFAALLSALFLPYNLAWPLVIMVVLGIGSLVFSIVGLTRIGSNPDRFKRKARGKLMGILGIISSAISLLLSILLLVLI